VLLPGQRPPLFVITLTDQVGTIVIVAGVCLVIAVVSVLIRAYILVRFSGTRVNSDDGVIVGALVRAIVHSALVENEAHMGLGKATNSLTKGQVDRIQQTQFADNFFYILSAWVSKISVTLFFFRLSPKRSNRRISQAIMLFVTVTGIAAILCVSVVSDLSRPWEYFATRGMKCTQGVSLLYL
jgi:uncharacterized membrane protein